MFRVRVAQCLKTGRKIKMLSMQGAEGGGQHVSESSVSNRQSLIEKLKDKWACCAMDPSRGNPPPPTPIRELAQSQSGIVILLRMCWRYSEEALSHLVESRARETHN